MSLNKTMEYSKEVIKSLPKGDVHNHLALGVSRKSLNNYLGDKAIIFPESYDGIPGMRDFIKDNVNTRITDELVLIKMLELAIEDSIADGVVYLEASIDINLTRYLSDSLEKLITIVSELKEKYKNQIEFRPEVGCKKVMEKEPAYKKILACLESGHFNSVDIYGPELGVGVDNFIELYDIAREMNIKTKVHIGEFSGHETILDAIKKLKPDEIQHGITAAYSKDVMRAVRDRKIQLNICPQSNLVLGAVDNLETHPIRKLYDFGIDITVNTDDLLLFDSTVSDQYCQLLDTGIFSFEEIEVIRKNSLKNTEKVFT